MKTVIPPLGPLLNSAQLSTMISDFHVDHAQHPLCIIGIRGYYFNTLGSPLSNDRNIYDDALFVYSDNAYVSYNANTDPSSYREGVGSGAQKGMPHLKPGVYFSYRLGLHRGEYLALVQQVAPVTVIRDGKPPYEETGYFGINIHKGSLNTTSSLGCQTIYPSQYESFINNVKDQAMRFFGSRWNATAIPYILLENTTLDLP
jgi:hypothetical protein